MVNSTTPPAPSGTVTAADLAEWRDRALRATDVSFVLTDATRPDNPVVWVNDAFTRTTGWTAAEVVGRNPAVLHAPGADPAALARMREAVAAERPVTVTVLNQRRDGTPFWNQVSLSPVRDDDGLLTHWVGVQVDVTDQVDHARAQELAVAAERRARSGLALVAQISDLLADLDDPDVLQEVTALLRHDVVRWAGFFLADGGLHAVAGLGGHTAPPPAAPTRRARAGDDGAASGRPDPVQALLDGPGEGPLELSLSATPEGPTTSWLVEHLRAALGPEDPRPTSVVVHPVPGRRGAVGLLVTVPHLRCAAAAAAAEAAEAAGVAEPAGPCGLEESDATVLSLVVRRVGMAVDHLRLYAREHRLAETLQRAMLPEQAEVQDLDVWTYYAPSSGHAQVGGDWYDVLQVDDGAVAVVIGDVVGHDVEAAAAMGQLRSVVRSYAFESHHPAEVLDRVDHLVAGMRIPRSASLVLGTLLRTDDGGWTLRYSRAGHLPPLVVRGGEVTRLMGGGGPMVGFGSGGRVGDEHVLLPGDVLVLYTDGLIERRDRTMREGLDALAEIAAAAGGIEAAGVGEELLSRLADGPEDDIAVVVVRVPDPHAAPDAGGLDQRRRRWSLPSEPSSIGRARQAVARACAAWGIPGAPAAELVVSELVANAVLHGWGHVVLRLFDTGDGLRVEVEDANPAPPVPTDGHPGRVGGYGMQIVERLGDWGWRPSGDGKLVWARIRPPEPGSPFHR